MGLGEVVLQIFRKEQNQKIVEVWNNDVDKNSSFLQRLLNFDILAHYASITEDGFRRGVSQKQSKRRLAKTKELAKTIRRTRHALLTTTRGVKSLQRQTKINDEVEVPSKLDPTYKFENEGLTYYLSNDLLPKPDGQIKDSLNISFQGKMPYELIRELFKNYECEKMISKKEIVCSSIKNKEGVKLKLGEVDLIKQINLYLERSSTASFNSQFKEEKANFLNNLKIKLSYLDKDLGVPVNMTLKYAGIDNTNRAMFDVQGELKGFHPR